MGRDFYEHSPAARAVFDEASARAGDSFLAVIFEGTPEALAQTRVQQPALLTVEVAIARHLESRGIRPEGCAGHSLGEFSALVAAGSLEFGDAFEIVQTRARLMSEDVPEGAMAAVLGLDPEAIAAALPEGVQVANYNGPQQTIISGTKDGIEAAQAALKTAGAKRVLPLPVSGPFHSQLMTPAAERFREALAHVPLRAPDCRFVSSVSGGEASDPEEIRSLLGRQICAPVRWTDVLRTVGSGAAVEVGPGSVLQGIAKRMEGAPAVSAAGTYESAQALGVE
jgi:[acyl-carrier-protein] S-malonyltransferase